MKKNKSFLSVEKIVKMFSLNQISISTFLDEDSSKRESFCMGRIDHYWRQIVNLKNNFNELKYPNVQKIMKLYL